jgi:hypothetical protein
MATRAKAAKKWPVAVDQESCQTGRDQPGKIAKTILQGGPAANGTRPGDGLCKQKNAASRCARSHAHRSSHG